MGGQRFQESATANHQRYLLGAEHKPRASLRASLPKPHPGLRDTFRQAAGATALPT